MKIKAVWIEKTLVFTNGNGGLVFATDEWPSELAVDDFLLCMCGMPENGWYPYYEQDHRWIGQCIAMVTNLSQEQIGAFAIVNNAGLDDECCSRSLIGASSMATQFLQAGFKASRSEARRLVLMNLNESVLWGS